MWRRVSCRGLARACGADAGGPPTLRRLAQASAPAGPSGRLPPPPVAAWSGRRLCSCAAGPTEGEQAQAFIEERGYSSEIAAGVVKALSAPTSGVPAGAMLAMVKAMAGRPEVGEDAGLEALCKSVEQEVAATSGKANVKFTVRPQRGEPFSCEGMEGMTLKEVAEHGIGDGAGLLREFIECACSGVMACSTCHVYVDDAWASRVGEPSEAEMDMIELAHEPKKTSRLGCQIKLRQELDGMVVLLPSGANNMFDNIPFD